MPYIITTTTDNGTRGPQRFGVTRRAVATLDEARDAVHQSITADRRSAPFLEAVAALDDSGGTVGPLPDGTTFEVGRVEWDTLRADLTAEQRDRGLTGAETIAAYNAAQGS